MSAAAITLSGVTKRFGSHVVLHEVSLDVPPGKSAVVLGPSGSGKTTLLRIIAGLDVPDAGRVSLNGTVVTAEGRAIVPAHRRRLGFVFQDLALWPHLTVRQHLEFVLDSMNLSRAERSTRADAALALVRVESLATRFPHQLSGGEQQRVALARAIVGEPRLLLLDEPLSSLDPELRTELRAELRRLQSTLGLTTVYVTHDREDAAVLADVVIGMRSGRIMGPHESNQTQEPP